MNATDEADLLERATRLFKLAEGDFAELGRVRQALAEAQLRLAEEEWKDLGPSRLVLFVKKDPDFPWPTGIHWATYSLQEGDTIPSHPSRAKWLKHQPELTDKLIYEVGEHHRADKFWAFDERCKVLAKIAKLLADAQVAYVNALRALGKFGEDEARGPDFPPPLIETKLPPSWIPAMGLLWGFLCRLVHLQWECERTAARHNATPPHPGIRMKFEVDKAHPYGRLIWFIRGEGRVVKLTDREMRTLHRKGLIEIPEAIREELKRHEAWRREVDRKYRSYVSRFSGCRNSLKRVLADARRKLERYDKQLPS